jgi:hypothetical protein
VSALFDRRWTITVDTLAVSQPISVSFRVTRSLYARAGTAEVTLYNLTADHRAELRAFRSRTERLPDGTPRRTRVRIEAGHREPGTSVIFQGNVRKVDLLRQQPDWPVKITAGDGEDSMRAARGSRAFGPDTRVAEVLRYAAEAMGVGLGNLPDAVAGAELDRVGNLLPGGAWVHGRVERRLHHLLRACGLEWSIQDGLLQVLPRGGALARTAVLLDPDHGLIETPEVGLNRVVKCKALLQPDLVPGAQVRLHSDVVKGYYRAESCEYTGESRGTPWDVALVLRRIRNDGSIEGVNP